MKKILVLIALLTTTVSCNKWLDVYPSNSLYEPQFMNDVPGISSAISGIYVQLASPALFGKELKFGLLDALFDYYAATSASQYPSNHEYYYARLYDYARPTFTNKLTNIWQNLYSCINQTNIIFDNIENISTDINYPLIKGETLGLRAFAHFELLRLFGPVIKTQGLEASAIPIYTSSSNFPSKFSTAKEVVDAINKDLDEALVLLENDPIKRVGRRGDGNIDDNAYSILRARGYHMNYFAILMLKAKVAQWIGDNETTAQLCKRIIDENAAANSFRLVNAATDFTTTTTNGIISSVYTRFSTEFIFSLFVNNMYDNTIAAFPLVTTESRNINSALALTPNYTPLTTLYTSSTYLGSTNDLRFVKWLAPSKVITGNYGGFKIIKYVSEPIIDITNKFQDYEMKIFSLGDCYLMLAESLADTDVPSSLSALNTLRRSRSLTDIPSVASPTALKNYIYGEIKKDNLAEGELFYYHKRNFVAIPQLGRTLAASTNVFNFRIPDGELEFNQPQK